MNVFKSLGGLIWGNQNNPELVQISSGQLYVYKNKGATQRTRECIYIDSMATVRRTSQPYQYILAITRVFEEGEESLQNDEDDLDDERIFLIDQEMQFKKGVSAGATAFSWIRPGKEEAGLVYEFVCDDETTVYTANNFEITIYQCMYERKYRKSHFSADDKAIQEFQVTAHFGAEGHDRGQRSPTVKKEQRVKKEQDDMDQKIIMPPVRNFPRSYEVVADTVCELNLFDPRTNLFMTQADNVHCKLLRTGKYTYWLVVLASDDKQYLAQPVETRMNPTYNMPQLSFIWNYFDEQQNVFSWLLRFPTEVSLSKFQIIFGQCMYEIINHQSWEKVSAPDQEYMIRTYQEDVDMRDNNARKQQAEEDSEEYSDEEEESYDEEGDEYEEAEDDEINELADSFKKDTAINSQLAVGYKDRSFVVRGNKIGVFKHNDEDGLDFTTTIKNISDRKGKELNPSRVVLHEQDTAMVMMDPRNLDKAYKMDLEYGKVVEEWEMPGTSGVLNLVGNSKYAHLTDNKTMVGHSQTAMFRVDPRLSGSKIVESEFKQYAKGNDFTCMATTDNGSLAIAGAKGDIKLLNVIGKNAKTALPGMGDPIIGIDVSADGRYILATCRTYILLIDVLNPENKKLGFDASFPAKNKPQPIKLHLRPEHVATMHEPVSFTPARFNTGVNELEKTIVTSTGPYVITWNFRRLKQGHTEYQLKKYSDNIVAENFKFGQDRSIIVALPHDVKAVPKRSLVSPAELFKKRSSK
ncbi:hypothetical protein BGZ51_000177 [Haplosporangium sp. Z 767]|nr:hypothetical protein BGZ51_000177 [Haplosporangium sp. Z 767]